jgi:hypothetical protein
LYSPLESAGLEARDIPQSLEQRESLNLAALSRLHLDAGRSQQGQAVAGRDHARPQAVIKGYGAVGQVVLEMEVGGPWRQAGGDLGQGPVVRGNERKGAAIQQPPQDGVRTDSAVL